MDSEKRILQQTKDICVYGCVCVREEEFGSVPHIVCNVTRKNNDLKNISSWLLRLFTIVMQIVVVFTNAVY